MPDQNSNTGSEKAQYFTFKIGSLDVEGIQMPDKSLGMTAVQIGKLVLPLVAPNQLTKTLKRLLPKTSSGSKIIKIRVNRDDARRSAETIFSVIQVTQILRRLDRKGNQLAQDLVDDMAGLALTELMNDGLGVENTKVKRQQYMLQRDRHRVDYHALFTRHIQDQDLNYPKSLMQLKKAVGLKPLLSVNEMDADQIARLNKGYSKYDTLVALAGMDHDEALSLIKPQS